MSAESDICHNSTHSTLLIQNITPCTSHASCGRITDLLLLPNHLLSCWVICNQSIMLRHAASRLARTCAAYNTNLSSIQHAIHTTSQRLAVTTIPLQTGRPTLVVLGTGWAAARLVHDIDPKLYDITVIAPRNHVRASCSLLQHLSPGIVLRWSSHRCWPLRVWAPSRAAQWQYPFSTCKRPCAIPKIPTITPAQWRCTPRWAIWRVANVLVLVVHAAYAAGQCACV